MRNSRDLYIFHLTAFLHQPRLNGVVVVDGTRATYIAQLLEGGLHKTGVIGGAALDDARLAIPNPIEVEAGQAFAEHR